MHVWECLEKRAKDISAANNCNITASDLAYTTLNNFYKKPTAKSILSDMSERRIKALNYREENEQ